MRYKKHETDFVIPPLVLTARLWNSLRNLLESKKLVIYDYSGDSPARLIKRTSPTEIASSVSYEDLKHLRNCGSHSISELKSEMIRLGVTVNWDPPLRGTSKKTILGNAKRLNRQISLLDPATRLEVWKSVIADYCEHCGYPEPEGKCNCWKDE